MEPWTLFPGGLDALDWADPTEEQIHFASLLACQPPPPSRGQRMQYISLPSTVQFSSSHSVCSSMVPVTWA